MQETPNIEIIRRIADRLRSGYGVEDIEVMDKIPASVTREQIAKWRRYNSLTPIIQSGGSGTHDP